MRVLDFTRVLAGPHATRMLTDLGADVIKVEPPAGDLTRFANPRVNGLATYFVQQNVGKRNVSIDLGVPQGIELALRLAEHCDVLIQNYRPGVMDRLGLGPATVATRNPRLVYASISGYGSTGPWVHRRAYAPVVGAETGFTKTQGDARGAVYANDPYSHADVYTSLEATVAILAALHQRERTGQGQHVEISMAETMLYVNEHLHDQLYDGPTDGQTIRSFSPGDFLVFTLANGQLVDRQRPPRGAGHVRALPRRPRPRAPRGRPPLRRRRRTASELRRAPRALPGRRREDPRRGDVRGAVRRPPSGRRAAAQHPRDRRERVGRGPGGDRRGVRPRQRHDQGAQRAMAVQRRRRRRPRGGASTAARTTGPCSPSSSATTTPRSTPSRPTGSSRRGCPAHAGDAVVPGRADAGDAEPSPHRRLRLGVRGEVGRLSHARLHRVGPAPAAELAPLRRHRQVPRAGAARGGDRRPPGRARR